jgi:hypothetical protein
MRVVKDSEKSDIIVYMFWSSLVFRNKLFIDIEKSEVFGIDLNPRFFMEFSESYIVDIDLPVTMPTKLLPTIKLLMKHEEDSSPRWIQDQHRRNNMSIEVIFYKGKFLM